jgi:hypothetical protein
VFSWLGDHTQQHCEVKFLFWTIFRKKKIFVLNGIRPLSGGMLRLKARAARGLGRNKREQRWRPARSEIKVKKQII